MRKRPLAAVLTPTLAACILLVLGACRSEPGPAMADAASATAREEAAATRKPSRIDADRLEARIATLMEDPDMVALAIGIIEDGDVRLLRGYGETLAGSGDKVTPDTVFRWASLSKGIAASLVVRLAGEGKLAITDPLSRFAITLTLPGGAAQVTVEDLLAHRVGLVRNAWDDRLEAGEDPRLLRASLGSLAPYCRPGTCHAYQNIAFDAVAEIVEEVTGEPYADAVRRYLFVPLAMATASHGREGLEASSSWAKPHHLEKQPTVVRDAYYRVPAAGGANGSIRDLVRWMAAQMGSNAQVLSADMLATLHRPLVPTPPRRRSGVMSEAVTDAAYGLGWRSFRYADHVLVGHGGSVDGYGSLVLFD
ncbi:MAG: serine hydrolase domain-containing protein, partial [Sphingomonadaceae bacterium]